MFILIRRILRKINYYYYKYCLIPRKYKGVSQQLEEFNINNINETINKLLLSNCSLSRFGDGELRWLLGIKHIDSFEKSSPTLSDKLLHVLHSNNKLLLITLPEGFIPSNNKYFVSKSRVFWKQFCVKYANGILPLLSKHKQYYDTSVSRPYIDYNYRNIAKHTFRLWKKLWNEKDVLIIEGCESRLGIGDDLFDNVNTIKRIECPPTDAFESYNKILNSALSFLKDHHNYLTLLSLGPTATIMSSDLCNNGFRAIDLGHIDIEYDWYLIGAKEKIDLPYKYVNENPKGHYALPIKNKKYYKEIINIIK